ncbi:3TM-type holin [Idiomarina sp.]|uniref:3TM-type holin n=1 Tax=Idiomarina sp. TaxID=1874361 RepID=UPI003A8E08F5
MDWSDIKGLVGTAAPLLGSLLGPAGTAAGGMIASALGVEESPEAVMRAIQQDPQAAVKLQQIEREHERELRSMLIQAQTAQLTQINETMRVELNTDGWYKSGWRPMIGYVTSFSFAGLMAGLVYALFKEPGKASDIIAEASIVLTAMLTVLGVNISNRSGDKRAQLGQNTPGILGSIAERIRKR